MVMGAGVMSEVPAWSWGQSEHDMNALMPKKENVITYGTCAGSIYT